MCRGCARRVGVDEKTVERLPAARRTCKLWVDFWFNFYVIFWYQIGVHPDVTKYVWCVVCGVWCVVCGAWPAHAFGRGRVLAVAGLRISLARIVKQWFSFWFHFLVIFLCQFFTHPDVTNYAREYAMLLKRDARGGRETKRSEQRSAALTCVRGPDVNARWCDRGRLGALSKARRAPRAKRMAAARKGVRWRGARW